MPRFDGTGPLGSGPLTGRGLGECRYKRRFFTRKEEVEELKEEAERLEEDLRAVKERISEMEK